MVYRTHGHGSWGRMGDASPFEKMWGITYAIYPLQVGLPPARGAELATIQKDVTALRRLEYCSVGLYRQRLTACQRRDSSSVVTAR